MALKISKKEYVFVLKGAIMSENKNLQNKIINATKWSTITEIVAKLISPITNMILARLLVPEAFGVVATITMIISFADMLTDSGFQKYLVQHEFKDENEMNDSADVAFWTNFAISIVLWGIISLFRTELAVLVGNPGLGYVISIACFQLPLTSFSSIQMALYRRDLDFKPLFFVRILAVCVPFVVTIPLALFGLGYWSIIIGSIVMQVISSIVLTVQSKWKPKLYYSKKLFLEMFSFSIWSLIEAIAIWLTTWVDSFIIGTALNQYYLGLYKTSTTLVNSLMALIGSAIIPILFSSLSRLQDDDYKFNYVFFKFQRIFSVLVFPLGVGIYLYRDLTTQILLGSQWNEASDVVGVWGLTSAILIVLGNFSSEVYRAKGRPKLSFFAQILHLSILVPVCIISAKYGFWSLVYARSLIRFQMIAVHFVIMKFLIGISISSMIKNILPTLISAVCMGLFGYFLQQFNTGLGWSAISIFLCILCYFGILFNFPNMRKELIGLMNKLIPNDVLKKYQTIFVKGK